MRKNPLTFDAVVQKYTYGDGGNLYAVRKHRRAHLVSLYPLECDAPAIPRALLASLKPGKSHRVRITVERIDDD